MREQIPVEDERFPRGWENICRYAFGGCEAAKRSRVNFYGICSVSRGELCGNKSFLDFQIKLDEVFRIL